MTLTVFLAVLNCSLSLRLCGGGIFLHFWHLSANFILKMVLYYFFLKALPLILALRSCFIEPSGSGQRLENFC